jgi:hypothetical protein
MNRRDERTVATEESQRQPQDQHRDGEATMTAGRATGDRSTAEMARAMEQGRAGTTTDADAPSAMRPRDGTAGTSSASASGRETPLFGGDESETFRQRWTEIQTGFVDEPRRAVEQADGLVAQVIQRLTQVFADERGKLEQQWDTGGDAETEDLRMALQRYRSFFERLLAA